MTEIKKKTNRYVKFVAHGLIFTVFAYVASALPNVFSKDYSNVAPTLNSVAHAETSEDGGPDAPDGPDGGCDDADADADCAP